MLNSSLNQFLNPMVDKQNHRVSQDIHSKYQDHFILILFRVLLIDSLQKSNRFQHIEIE